MDARCTIGKLPSLSSLSEDGPLALFLDFDGTLVELASGPDAIEPRTDLNRCLSGLADRLEGRVAVVSGRGIADIEKHLGPLSVASAGSHGSDLRRSDGTPVGDGPSALPIEIENELRAFAAKNALDYEHKPHGGALHYRGNPEAGEAAHAFAKQLAEQHGWAAQDGKFVIEIVAWNANKGAAVHTFMAEKPFVGSRAVFIGDDLTDEAGFAACEAFDGFGILVGERSETRAQYRLPSVQAVHEWLNL